MNDKEEWSNANAFGAIARSLGGAAAFGLAAAIIKPEAVIVLSACFAGLIAGYFLDRVAPPSEPAAVLGDQAKTPEFLIKLRRNAGKTAQIHN